MLIIFSHVNYAVLYWSRSLILITLLCVCVCVNIYMYIYIYQKISYKRIYWLRVWVFSLSDKAQNSRDYLDYARVFVFLAKIVLFACTLQAYTYVCIHVHSYIFTNFQRYTLSLPYRIHTYIHIIYSYIDHTHIHIYRWYPYTYIRVRAYIHAHVYFTVYRIWGGLLSWLRARALLYMQKVYSPYVYLLQRRVCRCGRTCCRYVYVY